MRAVQQKRMRLLQWWRTGCAASRRSAAKQNAYLQSLACVADDMSFQLFVAPPGRHHMSFGLDSHCRLLPVFVTTSCYNSGGSTKALQICGTDNDFR